MALSPSTTDELLVEQHDRIAVITLNRPERLNAISREMLGELSAKMVEANKDSDIRCIILTGAGRGFCSGLDLIETGNNIKAGNNIEADDNIETAGDTQAADRQSPEYATAAWHVR